MNSPANHWKLGLFMLVGVAGCIAAVLFLGGRSLNKETVAYLTYFDESVQGLELGSAVKFRGVSIGNVSDLDLAGDKRHVAVTYELGVKVLNSLGLAVERTRGTPTKLVIPPDLRAQLASSGITGMKFIQLDFFDVKANPPAPLPFAVAENHIPAVASMMKNLEDSVVQAVERFPDLAKEILVVVKQVGAVLKEIEGSRLPAKLAQTLALVDQVLAQVSAALAALEPGALSAEARQTLKSLNTALASLDQVMSRVGGDRGLAASALRTSEAIGSLALKANHVGPAMEDALKDVQGAAQSVQRLADALELDPDMLLKGRARRVSK